MSVEVADPPKGRTAEVLDDEALAFVGRLHERFALNSGARGFMADFEDSPHRRHRGHDRARRTRRAPVPPRGSDGHAARSPASRKDAEANDRAITAVAADKQREAADGFDGTWVPHPDVVATAMAEFEKVLGARPNQVDRRRDDVVVGAAELLDVASTPGDITEAGLRNDVNVGIQYISSWLRGNGAAGIYGMMEDAATAEIARSRGVPDAAGVRAAGLSGRVIGPRAPEVGRHASCSIRTLNSAPWRRTPRSIEPRRSARARRR
jgi:malate synthase